MGTTLTSKGQITIPKKIRETLGLEPGSEVEFDLDGQGRIVIHKSGARTGRRVARKDRFARARGRASVKWRTDELMALLRRED